MKKKKHPTIMVSPIRRTLALLLVFALCTWVPVSAADTASSSNFIVSVVPTEMRSVLRLADLPDNIRYLLPEAPAESIVFLTDGFRGTAPDTKSDFSCFELRLEDPVTGKGSVTSFSFPVKYMDSTGLMQFINTSMVPMDKPEDNYLYRNAANSFTVKFGKTARTGINFNEQFTFSVENDSSDIAKGYITKTEVGAGKIVYPGAFGKGSTVEFINTECGVKENILLEQNPGTNEFKYLFQSSSHTLKLSMDKKMIWVYNKDNLETPEYCFQDVYMYDSFATNPDETIPDQNVLHLSENCRYDLEKIGADIYLITIILDKSFLDAPGTVYPVTVDPSVVVAASNTNAQDSYVHQYYPTNNYGTLTYMRFGYNSGNIRSFFKLNSFPTVPNNVTLTGLTVTLTFRSGQTTIGPCLCRGVTSETWNESTITYNNAPNGVGSFPCTISTKPNSSELDKLEVSFSAVQAQRWHDGVYGFNGFIFEYNNNSGIVTDYNSVVTSEEGDSRTPKVTVTYETIPVTNVVMSKTNLLLNVGDTYGLTASVSPSNATDPNITWSSSNYLVATVSNNGVVTAIAPGTTTIYATANNGISASCLVTVSDKYYMSSTYTPLTFLYAEYDNGISFYVPVVYGITLNSSVQINYQSSPSYRRVSKVTAFANFEKSAINYLYGAPSIFNITQTKLNGNDVTTFFDSNVLVGNWIWDCQVGYPNYYVGNSAMFFCQVSCYQDGAIVPYKSTSSTLYF